MNISKLPFLDKKEKPEYFLCLILRNEKVKAVIFEKQGDTIKYLNQAQAPFTNTIEDSPTEEFLNALDKAITNAESVLPTNVETHKTLFGLKESWVEDNKIKKEYLEKLKKAGDELSLEPIGFLIFSEALVNLLQKEEGAPITAILAEVGEKFATVSLVKTGKIVEVRSSEIHESVSLTVDTILKHLQTPEVMPSRIILFDGSQGDLTQEFIGHKWSNSLPFLHLPQTLSLPKDSDIKAVLLGAATQMGANLVFDIKTPIVSDNLEVVEKENVFKTNETEKDLENKETLDYVEKDSSMEFFGFVGTDIAKIEPPVVTEAIANIPNEALEEKTEEIPEDVKIEEEQRDNFPTLGVLTTEKARKFSLNLAPILNNFKRNLLSILKVNGTKDKKLIIFGISLFIVIILFFFLFIFKTNADITIVIDPKTEDKTVSVTFSPNSSTNIVGSVLKAEIIPIDEIGSTTIDTKGKKDVGTKAKGAVTIFNNDSDSVNLAEGSTLTSSNGQKFTTDSSISIASASGDIFAGTKPGTKNVNVTAADIGTDYNLPSDTKFTVGNSKTVAAKNDNAFTGGTKKNITVVSKDDLAKLEQALPGELSNKAKSDISSKIKSGQTILPDFIDTDLSNEKFDKKLDDEAKQVSLNATVSFNYLSFNNTDMADFASKLFNNSKFSVEKSNLETSAKNIKILKNKDVTTDLNIKAKLFPKIDTNALINQLAGQDVQKAKNMLSNLENVQNVTIKISPNLPFVSSNLPKTSSNIKINITSN